MRTQLYRFDRVFDAPEVEAAAVAAGVSLPPAQVEELVAERVAEALETVREEAFQAGHAAGREAGMAEAAAAREAREGAAFAALVQDLEAFFNALTDIQSRLEKEAVETVSALLRQLAPELIRQNAELRLESLMAEVLRKATPGQRLVVRAASAHCRQLRRAAEAVAARQGEIALEVVADDTLAQGAIDISWGAGGVTFDPEATTAAVEEAAREILASLQPEAAEIAGEMSDGHQEPTELRGGERAAGRHGDGA